MSAPARSFQVTFEQIPMNTASFFTGPHSKFFKPASTLSPGVVQEVGENNEDNEASTEQADTSKKPLSMNGKEPTTLNQDESVQETDPESTTIPLTTSTEEETPGSFPTPSSSEEEASGDGETTTMMVGEEADVTTSKMNEDHQVAEKTRIKSGGAVVKLRVNERDSDQEKGWFLNINLKLFDHIRSFRVAQRE